MTTTVGVPLTEQQAVQAGMKQRRRHALNYMVPRTIYECVAIAKHFAGGKRTALGELRIVNTRDGDAIPVEALGELGTPEFYSSAKAV